MTTGIPVTLAPSAQFAFPRSYVAQLMVLDNVSDVERSGDTITVHLDRSIGYGIVYVLNSYIIPWSSNRYTIDHVIYDCWWFAFFDGVHHPQGYSVYYECRGSPPLPSILIANPAGWTIDNILPIPSAPAGYWLPPYPT